MGADCFRKADILVTPALPCDAFSSETSDLARKLSDGKTAFAAPWHPVYTMTPFNFSGHPACVVRSPLNGGVLERTGMPVAVQIVMPRHRDGALIQIACLRTSYRRLQDLARVSTKE